jgi:hypothetical protein
MKYLPLTECHLFFLRKAIEAELPNVEFIHICEALAAALGFQRQGFLTAEMNRVACNPPHLELDDKRFCEKLEQLGYAGYQYFSFEDLDF